MNEETYTYEGETYTMQEIREAFIIGEIERDIAQKKRIKSCLWGIGKMYIMGVPLYYIIASGIFTDNVNAFLGLLVLIACGIVAKRIK